MKVGLLCALMLVVLRVSGQNDSLLHRRNTVFGFPVVFWTPETRLGGGAAGIYNFYINKADSLSPASQIQAGFALTQERQYLYYLPFQLFWNERKWLAYGELGFYDYNYFFFGVGNDTGVEERYDVNYSRVRLNALRKVWRSWHIGLRLWQESWRFQGFEEGGALTGGWVPGSEGGSTWDQGVLVLSDRRDNVFYPKRGTYLELASQHATGSFKYSRYRADGVGYLSVGRKHVWANQIFIDVTTGNTPFYMMAMLGGTKRMRGFYEGRYRDRSGVMYQTEWRTRVWRRWGANAFFSAGIVDDSPRQWQIRNLRTTSGAGVRFVLDREKDLNIRFDVGIGKGQALYYFTIGEAF